MTGKRDYYKVLELSRNVSDKDIRAAYKKLAKKYHPDFNPDDKAAEGKFKEVSEAYAVLSNAEAKKKYDAFGHQRPGAPGFDFSGFDFNNMRGGFSTQGETFFGSFGDVLSDLFGGRAPKAHRTGRPRHGDPIGFDLGGFGGFGGPTGGPGCGRQFNNQSVDRDLRLKLKIDFELAAKGGVTQIHLSVGGKGEKISTRIPAGVDTGQTIRLKGKAPGGGDLLLEVDVDSHGVFRRDGLNLHCTQSLTIAEAVLGAKISVPTLDGEATITIPAGTQGGQTLRLRGRGIRKSGKEKGDLFVTVTIAVPKAINEKSKALIKGFDKENPMHPRVKSNG